ncbi:hypothetical protein [Chryseobacterium tongliaoense]|uniref:hypothetical protein n=1 Tax=Chryseobacterium tongliaoense TaxID=3240933 RepID=UPI0035160A38
MKPKQIPGVPEQIKGGFHDTESQKQYEDLATAIQKFEILKQRFLSVNQWKVYTGENSADFCLYDSSGNQLHGKPQIGNYVRIDIPGPGEAEAKGYDWVEIVDIFHRQTDEAENLLMTCRPSKIPAQQKNNHIAHFYSEKSISTFMVSRNGTAIQAAVYGRNEVPNMKAKFFDKIRNLAIAIGGIMGVSKIQWKALADGLLNFD